MRKQIQVKEPEEDSLINLTPLLDVLFLVLVFFILIAPFLDLDRIHLAESSKQKQAISPLDNAPCLKIYVRKDNSLWLDTNPISLDELSKILKEFHQRYPTVFPQLYPDKQCHFGLYQKIKNLVEESGFEQLDVLLKPE